MDTGGWRGSPATAIYPQSRRGKLTLSPYAIPILRFFACEAGLSYEPPDAPLPDAEASGAEAFWVVGAIAGG